MSRTTAATALVVATLLVTSLPLRSVESSKEPRCTYDVDMKAGTMRLICPDAPAVVNVIADQAHLQAEEFLGGYHNPGPGGVRYPTHSTANHPYGSRPGGWDNKHSSRGQGGRRWNRKDTYTGKDPYSTFVWNASARLDTAMRDLPVFTKSQDNFTEELRSGDINLRHDLDKIKRSSESADQLKDRIVAAMMNHYNFVRALLLKRNQELEKLVDLLTILMEVTSEGMHSAMNSHQMTQDRTSHLNLTLTSLRSMLTSKLRKKDKRSRREGKQGKKAKIKASCPREISAIGSGSYHVMNYRTGAYLVQSNNPNEYRSVYIMAGSGKIQEIEEYETELDAVYDVPARYISLPFWCTGTGHVVYRRHLYCHEYGTNWIQKYHMRRYDMVGRLELPGAGFNNTFPYSSGENTDIDLAVDELGLWAIYATKQSAGKVVISKLDYKNMELGKTWMTSYPKGNLGNAFMICGTLYATDSHKRVPTYIRYVFNTETGQEQLLGKGEMPFLNSALLGRPNVFDNDRGKSAGEGTGPGGDKVGEAKSNGGGRRGTKRGAWPATFSSQGSRRAAGGESLLPRRDADQDHVTTETESNSVMLSYDFRTSTLLSWNNGRLETFPVYFRN